jgi:hypothetical protein
MATPTSVPQINYPTRVDARHQDPKVTVAAALCLSVAGVVLTARLLIRWPWRRLLGLDDGAAIVASVRIPKTTDTTIKKNVLTTFADFCSGSMDGHHQCCIERARYSVGIGRRGSSPPSQEGSWIWTLDGLTITLC